MNIDAAAAINAWRAAAPMCVVRSHGRHRVRQHSSRVAAASFSLLGAAAELCAWRFHGATACANVAAASPSHPYLSSTPPPKYTLGAPTGAIAFATVAVRRCRIPSSPRRRRTNTRMALPRAPPHAATQQPRRRPLPSLRRLPHTPRRSRTNICLALPRALPCAALHNNIFPAASWFLRVSAEIRKRAEWGATVARSHHEARSTEFLFSPAAFF